MKIWFLSCSSSKNVSNVCQLSAHLINTTKSQTHKICALQRGFNGKSCCYSDFVGIFKNGVKIENTFRDEAAIDMVERYKKPKD